MHVSKSDVERKTWLAALIQTSLASPTEDSLFLDLAGMKPDLSDLKDEVFCHAD